ncbi:MAG: inner-rane translocator, partial [Thermoleophilia bacterium]|nr:inner-rane translocator [Thermoleophilia bacterium]
MDIFADLGFTAVVLTSAGIYAVFALGLQLQVGHAGLVNFGHVGYLAIGAYTVAVANERGHGVIASTLLAMLVALIASLVIGIVTLRLREDFLAITSIAASSLIYLFILNNSELTGGPRGIDAGTEFRTTVTRPLLRWARDNGWDIDRALPLLVIVWIAVALTWAFLMLLVRSPWGRMMRAVREDENAVRALGRNPFLYRLQALIIGAQIGALAGVLYGFNLVFITPES